MNEGSSISISPGQKKSFYKQTIHPNSTGKGIHSAAMIEGARRESVFGLVNCNHIPDWHAHSGTDAYAPPEVIGQSRWPSKFTLLARGDMFVRVCGDQMRH